MIFSDLERKITEINQLITYTLEDTNEVFFHDSNLVKPDFKNQEFSFYRLISFLYATYFETGKVGLKIITSTLSSEQRKSIKDHKTIVNNFRTKLQHNLDTKNNPRNQRIQQKLMDASKQACGKLIPTTSQEWQFCSDWLIKESHTILTIISAELESITDKPDSRARFKENWLLTTVHEIEGHYFDRSIEKYIKFLNINDFSVVEYRNKNLHNWRKYVREIYSGNDYLPEIDRIVQSSIIRDFIHVLPVTLSDLDNDLILTTETFTKIYKYMDRVNSENPQSRDELLESIKSYQKTIIE